jgi:hypothetical protein
MEEAAYTLLLLSLALPFHIVPFSDSLVLFLAQPGLPPTQPPAEL